MESIYKGKRNRSGRPDTSIIDDVYDGSLYKEHFNKNGYFHGSLEDGLHELHLSMQINTDGVNIFKSSKFGVWPIYAVINELPPEHR